MGWSSIFSAVTVDGQSARWMVTPASVVRATWPASASRSVTRASIWPMAAEARPAAGPDLGVVGSR